jgi:predicted DNA-binding transcriptional regulator AlpA
MAETSTTYPDGWPMLIGLHFVSQQTGMGRSTIYRLMSEGKFPEARKAGGQTVWLSAEIAAWCNALPKKERAA